MNKNILILIIFFIFLSFSLISYSILNEKSNEQLEKNLPLDILNIVQKYLVDSDTNSVISQSPHKITISKDQMYDSTKKNLKDVNINITYISKEKYLEEYPIDILNYKVDKKFLAKKNEDTNIYKIPLYDTGKKGTLMLMLLTDKMIKSFGIQHITQYLLMVQLRKFLML